MFGSVDFQRQRSGRGNRSLMSFCQTQHSRALVGIIFKHRFMVFDPHHFCSPSGMAIKCPAALEYVRRGKRPGNRKETSCILGESGQVLLEQPFDQLSEARR